jgi:beta-glucosidase
MSFSRFEYSNLSLSAAQPAAGQPLQVTVTVRNAGQVAGDEVVELYLDRQTSSPGMPFRTLQGFRRVHLNAGESKPVTFSLEARQLAFVDEAGHLVETPGQYTLSVGGSQPGRSVAPGAVVQQSFSITGAAVTMAP